MVSLSISRLDGETWRDCARRMGRKYGLEHEVMEDFARGFLVADEIVVHEVDRLRARRLPRDHREARVRQQARDLLLTGRIFGAEEALRLGLINEIVSLEDLLGRARQLATSLMENSASSLRATKQLLTDHARKELDAHIDAAVRENAAIRKTADFREGISAFLEKRKPVWTGK